MVGEGLPQMSDDFALSKGYIEKTLELHLPENKMLQSFDIWHVASPISSLSSLFNMWICGQNGLILEVTEITLTYKLKTKKNPLV